MGVMLCYCCPEIVNAEPGPRAPEEQVSGDCSLLGKKKGEKEEKDKKEDEEKEEEEAATSGLTPCGGFQYCVWTETSGLRSVVLGRTEGRISHVPISLPCDYRQLPLCIPRSTHT